MRLAILQIVIMMQMSPVLTALLGIDPTINLETVLAVKSRSNSKFCYSPLVKRQA